MRGSRPSVRRAVAVTLGVVVVVTWFTWLRPTTLGGDVSYVIVDGSSMEPTYDDGDLVIVREADRYELGDVIAFRAGGRFDDPTRIIHRIVGDAPDGGFTTQGDNRDELDPWQPTDDDIMGTTWFHVPEAGSAATVLSSPQTLAALGGAAVVLGGRRRRRRRFREAPSSWTTSEPVMTHSAPSAPTSQTSVMSRARGITYPRWAFVGIVACALLAVPTLVATWSAMRASDSTERTETTGSLDAAIGLDYQLRGPESLVYPDGRVGATRTGTGALLPDSPLYIQLLNRFEATVGFLATGSGTDSIASGYTVDVAVETPGGWSTTLDRIESEEFSSSDSQTIEVDLRSVADQVARVADLTGVGGDSYVVTVTPRLQVQAANDDDDVNVDLTAPIVLTVDGNLATVEATEASEDRTLTRDVRERADFAVGPFDLRTQHARALLSGLSLVLVAGIVWFASVLFGGVGLGEADKIAARYRSQIVDVANAAAPPGPVVMVGGIDELARIARVEQTVILHEDTGDGAHRYRVFLGSVTYEYATAPEHAGAATSDAEMSSPEAEKSDD